MIPQQGWEPTRRDDLPHAVTANGDWLYNQIKRTAGHAYFPFHYVYIDLAAEQCAVRGALCESSVTFSPTTSANQRGVRRVDGVVFARSLALLVWPGKKPDGTLFVCEQYRPEDVLTVGDLLRRAVDYGCGEPLRAQLDYLRQCVRGVRLDSKIFIATILAVRRPMLLIGAARDVEFCCYMINYGRLQGNDWQQAPVESAAHYEQIGAKLCRQLSGVGASVGSWTLLGAGSLGSKLALHLTRQGMAPTCVIDNGFFRAHNAVRHALMPQLGFEQALQITYKADLLCRSLKAFEQEVKAVHVDAAVTFRDPVERRRAIPGATTLVVNSTASLRVRETLAALRNTEMGARVAEAALFAQGKVGLVTIEGSQRSPNTGGLIAEFYRIAGANQKLRSALFDASIGIQRIPIGEGCGSATMVMSDALLSTHAAGMARIASRELETSNQCSRIWIGQLADDGISVVWTEHIPPSVQTVIPSDAENWRVIIPERVEAEMQSEIDRWPGVETGGILMGTFSEVSRSFYITDLLPAPTDSQRTPALFELGVKGLRHVLENYSKQHGWTLYCLGTWHSHLGASTPSTVDRITARAIAIARVAPSLLLIKSPSGFATLIADAVAANS